MRDFFIIGKALFFPPSGFLPEEIREIPALIDECDQNVTKSSGFI